MGCYFETGEFGRKRRTSVHANPSAVGPVWGRTILVTLIDRVNRNSVRRIADRQATRVSPPIFTAITSIFVREPEQCVLLLATAQDGEVLASQVVGRQPLIQIAVP